MIPEIDSEMIRWVCRVGIFTFSIIFSAFAASGIFLLLFDAINKTQDEFLTFQRFNEELENTHLLKSEKDTPLDETFYQS